MAAKRIHFRSEAREKVQRGAAALADALRVTLGPKARCVLIERKWGKPLVSDDGAAPVGSPVNKSVWRKSCLAALASQS